MSSSSRVTYQGISGNQPRIARDLQFGCPAATFDFDFTVTPSTECYPQNGGYRALRHEEVQSVSSVGQYPLCNGDRTFSSSDTFTPNVCFFVSRDSRDSTPFPSLTSKPQDPSFDNKDNIPPITGHYEVTTDPSAMERGEESVTTEPHIDLSPGHPTRFGPHSADGGSTSENSVRHFRCVLSRATNADCSCRINSHL
jgi:hypothetical protein